MQVVTDDYEPVEVKVGDFVAVPPPLANEIHTRHGQTGIIRSIEKDGTAIIMDATTAPIPVHASRLTPIDPQYILLLLERHSLVEAAINGFCDEA